MLEYPKVEHKLPEVFNDIIVLDYRRRLMKSSDVISFSDFKDNKETRQRLRIGAENFIIKQKGGKT